MVNFLIDLKATLEAIIRIAFGMKKKARKKVLVPQGSFVNSQEVQLQPILSETTTIKQQQDEII